VFYPILNVGIEQWKVTFHIFIEQNLILYACAVIICLC